MKKTSQEEYLKALEEANSAIEDDYQDDNAPGFESEAEQMAASLPPKRVKRIDKPLTSQQQTFVRHVIEGKTRREAYRLAYNTQMSDSAVSANASKLAADPRIASMITAAWDETIEHLADDAASTKRYVLRKLVSLSKEAKQEGSRLKALEMLGKSVGLFVTQEETKDKPVSADQLKRELSGHLKLLEGSKGKKAG